MSKQTVPTPHGEVEYETVECASCGNDVAKTDAYRFLMYRQGSDPSFVSNADEQAAGWACPYCYDAGPADFPRAETTSEYAGAFYRALLQDPVLDGFRFAVIVYIVFSAAALMALPFVLLAV
jgi:hypothetical protein